MIRSLSTEWTIRRVLQSGGVRDMPPNLTYIFVHDPCYSLFVAPSIKGANHGMDRTEARRDRPQLRNQLVRKRRALIEFQLSFGSRFQLVSRQRPLPGVGAFVFELL